MILIEKKVTRADEMICFGDKMKDGRLVEPSKKTYRVREAVLYQHKVGGRELTSEEMKRFEIENES